MSKEISEALKHIDVNTEYQVSYLASHQSKSGEVEYGIFCLLGIDLTHNQIIHVYRNSLRYKKLKRILKNHDE